MRRLTILGCLLAIPANLGCDTPDGPQQGTASSGTGGGSSGGTTTADQSTSGPTQTSSTQSTGQAATGQSATGEPSSSEGTSSETGETSAEVTTSTSEGSGTTWEESGSESSTDGSSSTGGPDPMMSACDDAACITECSRVVPGTEDGGFGPCYEPYGEWTRACDYPQACPLLHAGAVSFNPGAFVYAAHCIVEALMLPQSLRLDYTVEIGSADFRNVGIFSRGDGTAMLELTEAVHCNNGGAMGMRPFKTGVRTIDFGVDAELCATTADAEVLYACLFGLGEGDYDQLPWLENQCLDEAPTCELD